jgi:hypothetical protein
MLQGTIAAFGDRILSSAEEIGRCYSRFREQALRIRKGNDTHHAAEGAGFVGVDRPAQDSGEITDSLAGFLESWRGI